MLASESPVAGDQEQLTPPEAERGVEAPAQIAAEPEAAAVGRGLTVTTIVAGGEEHPFKVAVTEYVPVAAAGASGIDGFRQLDVKPFGPVQL